MHAYIHACMHAWMHARTHAYIYIYIYTYMYMYIHTYICIYIYIYIYSYIYICIYICYIKYVYMCFQSVEKVLQIVGFGRPWDCIQLFLWNLKFTQIIKLIENLQKYYKPKIQKNTKRNQIWKNYVQCTEIIGKI